MAEYIANAEQTVNLNNPLLFSASISCNRGNVYHEDETGIFILKAKTPCAFARYEIEYNGNIAIPEGGAVTPIAVGIALNGEIRPASRSISTPTAVGQYNNVTSKATVDVPAGCCFTLSVRAISGVDDPAVTPTPAINAINSKVTIKRVA